MKFRDNILLYMLVPLVILCAAYSYFRFMVAHDYMIAYEGTCDPATQDCFIGCNDDACTDVYYYAKVQKYAVNLYAQCGEDITNCDAANACLPVDDQKCSITYCDPKIEEGACDDLSAESSAPSSVLAIPTESGLEKNTTSATGL